MTKLSTGRVIEELIIGLNENGSAVSGGYDSGVTGSFSVRPGEYREATDPPNGTEVWCEDNAPVTDEERAELARLMIERWMKWGGLWGDPPKKPPAPVASVCEAKGCYEMAARPALCSAHATQVPDTAHETLADIIKDLESRPATGSGSMTRDALVRSLKVMHATLEELNARHLREYHAYKGPM